MNRALALTAFALLAAQGCRSRVDPDAGRFSCARDDECGEGWVCIKQYQAGGLCFRAGTCDATEVCDGVDQNCEGRIDETFPESGLACTTGRPGICSAGTTHCADGGLYCLQTKDAGVEKCNGLDDDCDGVVDNGFDLNTDPANCGKCGNVCPGGAGTGCKGGICYELNCSDGLDNDTDGGIDCEDPACLGMTCSADLLFNCGGRDADAGTDGGVSDGGSDGGELDGGADAGVIIFCVPKETACDNGADDDLDGLADCADSDCDGKTCGVGAVCTAGVCPPAG